MQENEKNQSIQNKKVKKANICYFCKKAERSGKNSQIRSLVRKENMELSELGTI